MADVSLLSGRALVANATHSVDAAGYHAVEFVMGPGQYFIRETIYTRLPVSGSKDIGTYLSAAQSGDTLTLTARAAGYLHDVVGIR